MYYVNYDNEIGEILGIYPSNVDKSEVPEPSIEITDEEWVQMSEGNYYVSDGGLKKYEAQETHENDNDTDIELSVFRNNCIKKLVELKNSYIGALIIGDYNVIGKIQEEYKNLLNEFARVNETLKINYDVDFGEKTYCLACGTALENGICPKCYWVQ